MAISLEQLKEQLAKIEAVLAGELSEIDRLQLESDKLVIQSQIDERTVLAPAEPAPEVPAEPVQEPAPTPVEEPAPETPVEEPAPETPVEEPTPAPVEEPTPVESEPEAPVEPAPEIPAEPLPTPEPGEAEPVPAPAPVKAQYPTDEEHILVGQSGDEELKNKFLAHVLSVTVAKMAGN